MLWCGAIHNGGFHEEALCSCIILCCYCDGGGGMNKGRGGEDFEREAGLGEIFATGMCEGSELSTAFEVSKLSISFQCGIYCCPH